jgi:hypothetical protein
VTFDRNTSVEVETFEAQPVRGQLTFTSRNDDPRKGRNPKQLTFSLAAISGEGGGASSTVTFRRETAAKL